MSIQQVTRLSLKSLLYLFSAALSILIAYNHNIHIVGGGHDDLLYLTMAETIVSGQWLGPYNHMTLIRPPTYPLLVALNALLEWRLHIFQQALYLLCVLLLTLVLRLWNISSWKRFMIFFLCAFHPGSFVPNTFVITEALYPSAATALLAGCLGFLGATRVGLSFHKYVWLGVTTIAMAVFWTTRPEGVWILPFLGGTTLVLWRHLRRQPASSIHQVMLSLGWVLAVSLSCTILSVMFFAAINQKYYGVRVIHELAEPNFVAAMNWLTRLAPESRRPQVPVTKQALEVAYQISPAFAQLKPYLTQQTDGKGWGKSGCSYANICDDISGGWFVWAVRDGVHELGYYSSGQEAARFFYTIAEQIKDACRQGHATCANNPTGNILAPPLTLKDLPVITVALPRLAWLMISFGDLLEQFKYYREISLAAPAELTARYHRITHDQNRPQPLEMPAFYSIQFFVFSAIQLLGGLWVLAWIVWRFLKANRFHPESSDLSTLDGLVILLSLFIIGRLGLITYLDVMSFPATIRYLLAVYPALLTLIVVTVPTVNPSLKKL